MASSLVLATMASIRATHRQFSFSIGVLSMAATMHRIGIAAMLVLPSCFLFLATHAQQQPPPAGPPSCLPHERDALLAFKHGVTSDPAGLLTSWRRDGGDAEQDCCRWRGVRCSNLTGHVHKLRLRGNYDYEEGSAMKGKISPPLLALEHLEHLDLSGNELEGPTGRLPEFLGSLKSLKYLNLSGIPFHGHVPPQLGNLSNLQYLDLSNIQGGTNSIDISWLICLPSIQYLNLGGVNLNTVVDWPHVMNMLPSLRVLHLSGCSLVSANQALQLLNLTNLEELDASWNSFDHPMVTSWFWNITSLKYLYLSSTRMYGRFPDALGNMASLQVLDLSYNNNFGVDDDDEKNKRVMTADLKNLCNLEVLNLQYSFLHGDLTELFRNLPHCSPNKLQELNLGVNQLTGKLPRWIENLTSLVTLDLGLNNIVGHVPYVIGKLSALTHLDLSGNKLDGVIMEEHFVSATSLQYIDLSHNSLKIEISSDWQPPSRFDTANFAGCQMGPLFPGWLQWQVNITYLDISSAGIADRLPQWFFDSFTNVEFMNISNNQLNGSLPTNMGFMSLQQLYLSSNQLTGQIPTLPPNITILDLSNNFLSGPLPSLTRSANQLNSTLPTNLDFISLQELYLSSNQFTGQIPTLPPNINTLDLSNNFLSGTLPSATQSANLIELFLFSNQITGHIPQSFCKFQELVSLDLSNNFLEGELPSCLGVMKSMKFIALSNNSFSGDFPSCVQNFANIMFIDLSRNKFSGRLPMWIGNLAQLIILQLSHNKFFGNIPANITNLAHLQYMDLNNNEFSGPLPSYLSNMEAMIKTQSVRLCFDNQLYTCMPFARVTTVWKGHELNYGTLGRVLINNMTTIDLSSNNLTGEIPEQIVALVWLVNLNLSRNHLSGVIPNKIGKMRSLQSLDLSWNELSGKIPSSLSNLTFLSDLDLSYNNLTGRIPSGTQLDTLYAEHPSMYIGNTGLCGHPLPNSCSSEGHEPKPGALGRKEGHGIEFFYLGLACGFVVGAWMAFGVLLLKRSWRIACFRLSDKLCDKVYVLVAIWARKTGTDHHA